MNLSLDEVLSQMQSKQSVVLIQRNSYGSLFSFWGNPIDAFVAEKIIQNFVVGASICYDSSLVRTLSKI